jgi:hypothetical protein
MKRNKKATKKGTQLSPCGTCKNIDIVCTNAKHCKRYIDWRKKYLEDLHDGR